MKIGVVDVGGGLRGIYAAGIFDYCLDNDINFDTCIGVSAGSANVASYVAKQRGRNYKFYAEYSFRRSYMSLTNFIFKRSYIDLEYIYGKMSNTGGEYPIDYENLMANPAEMIVVGTRARTGKPMYFDKSDMSKDHYEIFMASSAIPYVCKPHAVHGLYYFDGALGDPVPTKKAFEHGCDKVVVILTKPISACEDVSEQDMKLAKKIEKKFPQAAASLRTKARRYKEGVEYALKCQEEGTALVVYPDDTCGVDTVKRNKENFDRFYKKGYEDAKIIKDFVKQ